MTDTVTLVWSKRTREPVTGRGARIITASLVRVLPCAGSLTLVDVEVPWVSHPTRTHVVSFWAEFGWARDSTGRTRQWILSDVDRVRLSHTPARLPQRLRAGMRT